MGKKKSLIPSGVAPRAPSPEQLNARLAYQEGRLVTNRRTVRNAVSRETAESNSGKMFERIASYLDPVSA